MDVGPAGVVRVSPADALGGALEAVGVHRWHEVNVGRVEQVHDARVSILESEPDCWAIALQCELYCRVQTL